MNSSLSGGPCSMESHYSRKQWLEFQLLLSYQWLSGFKSSNRFPGTRQPLVSRLPGGKHGEVRHFRAQDSGWECGRVWVYQAWSLRFYLQRLQPSMVIPAFTLRAWRTAGGSEDQGRQGLREPLSQNKRLERHFHSPCPGLFE